MAAVNVRIVGLEEVQALFRAMPETLFKGAKKEYQRAALNVHKAVSDRIRNGTPLHSRTGNLRRQLNFGVSGTTLETLSSAVWNTMIYAPIQETGGTIKAKKAYLRVPGGPYLNIPLAPNKTAAGVTRRQAREVFAAGGHLVRARSGKWLVMLDGEPQFVLVKEVDIPARLGLFDAADDEVPHLLQRLAQVPLDG